MASSDEDDAPERNRAERAQDTVEATPEDATSNNSDTSTAAPTTRAPSALHNRLLNQQRSNILLQVLFHHMLNSRRRREEEEALALTEPPPLPPDRVMPVLSHEEAVGMNAICRFCFEGSLLVEEGGKEEASKNKDNEKEDTNEKASDSNISSITATPTIQKNALIAPCNCTGGSRWVHLECLRQWQRMQVRNVSRRAVLNDTSANNRSDNEAMDASDNSTGTVTYTAAGYSCNVCTSPYLSRPPTVRGVRRNLLRRGTLLVSRSNHVGRTFQQTVVLLLSNGDDAWGSNSNISGNHGSFGLIVNAPLHQEASPTGLFLPPSQEQDALDGNDNAVDGLSGENGEAVTEGDGTPRNSNSTDVAATTSADISLSPSSPNPSVEWRRGGPVCGGRLGVIHYTILHTYPPTLDAVHGNILDVDIDEEYFDDDDNIEEVDEISNRVDDAVSTTDLEVEDALSDNNDDDSSHFAANTGEDDDDLVDDDDMTYDLPENGDFCGPISLPVFDISRNTPSLQFLASTTTPLPSTFSEEKLEGAVQQITGQNQSATDNASVISDEPAASDNATEMENTENSANNSNHNKVLIFSGYCKWRAGQLEREIQREVWDICVDATPADVFRPPESGFWEEIRESDRLLSWQQLVEEENAGGVLEEDD